MKDKSTKVKSAWVMPYLNQQKWRYALAALAAVLAVLFAGALLFTSGYLISRASLQPENVLMIYVPIVLVRAFGFGKAAIQYVERLLSHDTVLRMLSSMRVRLYRILEPQALALRSRYQTGNLLGILAEDIELLQHVFLRVILPAIVSLSIYTLGIVMLGTMDIVFALYIALYCGIFLFVLPIFVLIRLRHLRQSYMNERSRIYETLTDAVLGMSDWLLSGRSKQFLQAFKNQRTDLLNVEVRLRRSEWRLRWLVQSSIAGAVLGMVWWAGHMHADGNIAAEWIAAYALVLFPLLEAFSRTSEAILRIPDYQQSIAHLRQVDRMGGKLEPTIQSKTEPLHNSNTAALNNWIQNPTASSFKAGITMDHVDFRYPNEKELALKDISLHIPPGSKIAIIGRSGSGKSTLLNIILGELSPSTGTVTSEGVVSHSISESSQNNNAMSPEPTQFYSILNQQPYLFDTTIVNNIRLAKPEATNEDVMNAAKLAGLGPLIDTLPDGLDTRVREAGVRFSGGERRRIALARILLQQRPIVLLDEPTVGLDPLTERELLNTLFHTLKDKTLIWITHHLTGMEHMDNIVFMDNGRIVMRGNHQQLLERYERYRKLYDLDHVR